MLSPTMPEAKLKTFAAESFKNPKPPSQTPEAFWSKFKFLGSGGFTIS